MLNNKKIEQLNEILLQIEELEKAISKFFTLFKDDNRAWLREKVKGKSLVIAINGANGVGKDTFALKLKDFIETNYSDLNVNVHIFRFADPLKYIIKDLLGVDLKTIEELKRDENATIDCSGNTIRDWLNKLGEGIKKYLDNDIIFADKVLKDMSSLTDFNKFNIFIVPDLRFNSEDWYLYQTFEENYFPVVLKNKESNNTKKVGDFDEGKARYIININKQDDLDNYAKLLFEYILEKFLRAKEDE